MAVVSSETTRAVACTLRGGEEGGGMSMAMISLSVSRL